MHVYMQTDLNANIAAVVVDAAVVPSKRVKKNAKLQREIFEPFVEKNLIPYVNLLDNLNTLSFINRRS